MYDHDDLFVKSGECFCWYCFIITCIIDLRLREGLMMLTVIYFVLVQPLDNDDRGILDIYQKHSWRTGDITWLFTLIILPILIRIRIIAILLLNICFISKEDYPPEYHIYQHQLSENTSI